MYADSKSPGLGLLFIASLCACGDRSSLTYPYVTDFARHALEQNRYIDTSRMTLMLAPLYGSSESIECTDGRGTAIIDSQLWSSTLPEGREAIVFHVLGHCLLQREHREDMTGAIGLGAPASIMHARFVPYYFYGKHREYYVKELFAPVPSIVHP